VKILNFESDPYTYNAMFLPTELCSRELLPHLCIS